jgi:hypothetical protein
LGEEQTPLFDPVVREGITSDLKAANGHDLPSFEHIAARVYG